MRSPTAFSKLIVAVLATLAVTAAAPSSATAPTVLATEPANGATGIAADLETIVITFSEPMGGGSSFSGTTNFHVEWNSPRDTCTLVRPPTLPPWTNGQIVSVNLNPPPYYSFADPDNNVLATYVFTFTVGGSPDPGAPKILSMTPTNGRSGVDIDLETVSIEFSEPMEETIALNVAGPWPVSSHAPHVWSTDRRTLGLRRDNPADPLPYFSVIMMTLNPTGVGFEDADGHPLGAISLAFTIRGANPDEPPSVVSSDPYHGERGVGVFRDSMTVNFSKAMTTDVNLECTTGNWPGAADNLQWAPDRRSFTVPWPDDQTLLPSGALISFTLNPGGAPGFRDTGGNPLPETLISFHIEGSARLLKIRPVDSMRSFDWPYYLWIPQGVAPNTVILVEPNNTGGVYDSEQIHDGRALGLVGRRLLFADRLNVPLLVPTFPRPLAKWWIYTHALDVDSMTASSAGLVRFDLQLIEMIEDARERLADLRIQTDERVLMMGFSASGQFTNRFAILHPERTLAAAAGSPGGWPLAPVSSWQGETLNYNVGIADASALLGTHLDMAAVRSVPILLYMGDSDTNDSVPFSDGYSDEQREQVFRLFGANPVERWPVAEAIYESAGMNSTFVLYPGVGHSISDEMYDDIADFFSGHIPQSKGWLRLDHGRRVGP